MNQHPNSTYEFTSKEAANANSFFGFILANLPSISPLHLQTPRSKRVSVSPQPPISSALCAANSHQYLAEALVPSYALAAKVGQNIHPPPGPQTPPLLPHPTQPCLRELHLTLEYRRREIWQCCGTFYHCTWLVKQ